MPKVAFLTSGGIAPCLSASIGGLIEKYNELDPDVEMIGYMHGYRGLLLGKSVTFSKEVKENYQVLEGDIQYTNLLHSCNFSSSPC